MINASLLSTLIASRICHDLVSPVTSINTALELLNDPQSADMHDQAEHLLQTGAHAMSARIEFLRYALGASGLSSGAADLSEVRRICEAFASDRKTTLRWALGHDDLSCSGAQVLLNLLIMAMTAIPRGGVVTLSTQAEEAALLTATARAHGGLARLDEVTRLALSGNEPDEGWSARTVQPVFAKMIVEGLGGDLEATISDNDVIFTATRLPMAA